MIDALFGSKTRVKLLHLFLNNPGRSFYVREITRKIDEQINSVRRELSNLQGVGVIKTDNSGDNNRLYYEVDQAYAHFEALKAIFSDGKATKGVKTATSTQADWSERLAEVGDIRLGVFSGKLVKGSVSPVDIFLVGTINKPKLKKAVKQLEEEERTTLNYATMGYEDFYYRFSIKDRFVTEVLQKATVLIDRESIISHQAV
jgi:hypothetical protein